MSAMLATDFGDAAMAAAERVGINAESLAGIGQVESNFHNVPTANGSSSATGPWQVTARTWQSTVAAHNLGYSIADMTNPSANAVVASYIIRDYAGAVSNATGQPATTLDAYGAYIFGPTAGAQLATANANASLSSFISSQALANNGMQSWSVGDFRSVFGSRLGSSASQLVLSL
ncbi:MAG: transglycosylase SLT domain-containing protein [Acetobacteraceae bacterium]|nr:transglycosylase SLT domain-containing protein [Acetobacteraceae bacterium]